MSIRNVTPDELNHTMRVGLSNRTFVELVKEREDLDTLNAALTKIINVARQYFSLRSKAGKKVMKENQNRDINNKNKSVTELGTHETQDVRDDCIGYYKEQV